MTPLEAFHSIEKICPGFFKDLGSLVWDGDLLDEIADRHVEDITTEESARHLNARIEQFHAALRLASDDQLEELTTLDDRTCQFLVEMSKQGRAHKRKGKILLQGEDLHLWLQNCQQLGKVGGAFRWIPRALYSRAHVVAHHWDDYPIA